MVEPTVALAVENIARLSLRGQSRRYLTGVVLMVAVLGVATVSLLYLIKQVDARLALVQQLDEQIASKQATIEQQQQDLASVQTQSAAAAAQLAVLQAAVSKLPPGATTDSIETALTSLDSSVGRALVASGSGSTASSSAPSATPLSDVIERLFGRTAAIRGGAYAELMSAYGESPELVPALLKYAQSHMDNANGVYNTLVVLSHLNYARHPNADVAAIREFAELARTKGDRTSQRVDVLLSRLPT
jgi:hypothetical protein